MRSSDAVRRLLQGLVLSAYAACASVPTQPRAATPITPDTLYPLRVGWAWSYDVDSGDGQPVLATTRVRRAEAGLVEVQTGQSVQAYRILPEGIQKVDVLGGSAYFLLPAGLSVDRRWASGPEFEARVVSVQEQLVTPAGSFAGCVVVEEQNRGSGQQITTTYCPDVGPTRVVSQMAVRGQSLRVQALLRGFASDAP